MAKKKPQRESDEERLAELFEKHGARIPASISNVPKLRGSDDLYITSREYKIFTREEPDKWQRLYERACAFAERVLPVKVPPEKEQALAKAINITELKVTPRGVSSLSVLVLFAAIIVSISMLFISTSLLLLAAISGYVFYNYMSSYPEKKLRENQVKSSGESILAILYLVIYMRHTPNLEAAVKFASDNLTGPLANSFRKLLWDVQSRKYKNISEALDAYTIGWGEFNKPFTDSIYLIEASLYQSDSERRKDLLNRALDRILDGTFDEMSEYAHKLKTPVDTLYTIGMILPVLGLVMFPMFAAFLSDTVPMRGIAIFYNIVLPALVLLFEKMIFSRRPVGFPVPDISGHPDVPRKGRFKMGKRDVAAWIPAIIIFLLFTVPFLVFLQSPSNTPSESDVIISLLPIFGLGGGIYAYTKLLSRNRLDIIKDVQKVEKNLSDALFQLGMRIGEGYPPEVAIQRVSGIMRDTEISTFLNKVVNNMKRLGFSFERAIFDENYGAIKFYPSPMLKSVMEVFVSSAKKSLEVTSVSLVNIARYLQNINRINTKIQDILADTVAGLKFQASVITPVITGVVVGLTTLIIIILSQLSSRIEDISAASGGQVGPWAIGLFAMSGTTPLYIFQPIVGLYLIEVVVLIALLNADIETNGHPIWQKNSISGMVLPAVLIYTIITIILTVIFAGLGRVALAVGGSFGV